MSNHVTTNLVTSSNVMNATPVRHNIVLHVNHNMNAKKTLMLHHKHAVNSALNVKSCTSIP
jgi:hypothetical protein